jgi:hypothetical protein
MRHPGSQIIDLDRQPVQTRIDVIQQTIAASALEPKIKELALTVLRRELPADRGASVAGLVFAAYWATRPR